MISLVFSIKINGFPLIPLSELCFLNSQQPTPLRRGAGAPEVLRRETAEEEFRLRRNQPLNMAPSAPNDRYCQADFLRNFFEKVYFFRGPEK